MRAMILAAGRGERMGALTAERPKPLLKLAGKALIDRVIMRLVAAGITDLVVNLAYRGEQIRTHLGDGTRYGASIAYAQEPEGALDTGGGIGAALGLLGDAPFIVVNSDVFTDFDFARLRPPAGLVHLVMVPNPPHHPGGDFCLAGGRLSLTAGDRATFAGIGVYSPRLFAGQRPGRYPLALLLKSAIGAGEATGELFRGVWFDVGTPQRLATADAYAASQHVF